MPMATHEIAASFEDDGDALRFLESRGWEDRGDGFIVSPRKGYLPEPGRESDAVDYLLDEWDFGWVEPGAGE